jgi:SH3-like domain-containing protein
MKNGKIFLLIVALGFIGCAVAKERVAAPREEIKVYFYVGAEELALKKTPDYGGVDVGTVKLNDRVQKVEYGEAGWFLVRTADGRQGWINERYLKVDPVSELFVRRWGVRLKAEPEKASKSLSRLRANDLVRLLEKPLQGWVKVTVARTQETGWLEMRDLAVKRVVFRPVRRKPAAAAEKEEAEEPGDPQMEAEELQPSLPKLAPSPAKAEPPPVEEAPGRPKVKPEIFEPF